MFRKSAPAIRFLLMLLACAAHALAADRALVQTEICIEANPRRALFDAPLQITLSNCPRGQQITVRAQTTDARGIVWESASKFLATNKTTFEVQSEPSLAGSHAGIDPLALLSSMKSRERAAGFSPATNFVMELQAELNGHVVSRVELQRLTPEQVGVHQHEIRSNNIVGDLYLPTTNGPLPGIILLGGSDGEPMKLRSGLIAAHGYVVLNLFYFGHDSLPKDFAKIPLEYLTNAVGWLQRRPEIDPARIGIVGHSRGAEAALLIASVRADIRAVVAVAASAVVWPGPGTSGYFSSAWSHGGKELPYVPVKFSKGFGVFLKEIAGSTQIEHRPLFEDALKNKSMVVKARIPVEKIKGAVLLISGKDDRVWPSASMSEMIIRTLGDSQHPFNYHHVSYENAGHNFGLPGLPQPDNQKEVFKMGGTVAGNAAAAARSWQATLEFLENELRHRKDKPLIDANRRE